MPTKPLQQLEERDIEVLYAATLRSVEREASRLANYIRPTKRTAYEGSTKAGKEKKRRNADHETL